jgi:dihydrodipicolinate synthase/N-acetylneuraminate lyase
MRTFPDFLVFAGSESHLLADLAAGAPGNVNARAIAGLIAGRHRPDAPARQQAVNAVRDALRSRDLFAGVKTILAARHRDEAWLRMRPPLLPLKPAARAALLAEPAIAEVLGRVPA